jgi:predicted ArsR family transcriptional regulator
MTPDADPPPEFSLAGEVTGDLEAAPTDERVYRVAIQLYEPTRVSTVAERADCSPDTARRHLGRLADIGVLERVTESPTTYRRNESCFEWRTRNRLEGLSASERRERLATLTAREREFREQYGADRPENVDALDHAEYAHLEDVWLDLSEWETVRRRIRRLEEVRQGRTPDSGSEVV